MNNGVEIFIPNGRRRAKDTGIASQLMPQIAGLVSNRDVASGGYGELMLSSEGLGESQTQVLNSGLEALQTELSAICNELSFEATQPAILAATASAVIGSNPRKFLETPTSVPNIDGKWSGFMNPATGDGSNKRQMSMESYDERTNRNAALTSVLYNLLAIRQDAFGELFFPTIVVNPTEVGIALEAKLITAIQDFRRSASGALANFRRQNVIRAYADASILKNELTRAVPVRRTTGPDANESLFVSASDVTPWTFEADGLNIPTSYLRVGPTVDLIGISGTDELYTLGVMDVTDSLDTFNQLDRIAVRFTDGTDTDILHIDTTVFPGSTFTYAPQGRHRRMMLDLDTDSLVLSSDSPREGGGNMTLLTELANHTARVRLRMSGSIEIAEGKASVQRGSLELVTLRNNTTGDLADPAIAATIATKIEAAEVIGWTSISYRANSNLRQRGQLIETVREYQLVNIPYRSPITTLVPATDQGENDASAVQTLINATNIRNSNSAVTTILRARTIMDSYRAVGDEAGELPTFFGMGRHYVRPYFAEENVDLAKTVDSRTSHERIKDIRGALVEKLRYHAAEMYRMSEYKAAVTVLTGQPNARPVVLIGTDPVIHQYLMADGDLRTLGEEFQVQIVSTIDHRMKGRIIMSFGLMESETNNQVNPLHFGNFLWSPEVTVVMPISRQNQVSRELVVTPRFLHLVNLPIMVSLTVENLPTVTDKVIVYNREIPA